MYLFLFTNSAQKNGFQYVRWVYATAINFPCIIILVLVKFWKILLDIPAITVLLKNCQHLWDTLYSVHTYNHTNININIFFIIHQVDIIFHCWIIFYTINVTQTSRYCFYVDNKSRIGSIIIFGIFYIYFS